MTDRERRLALWLFGAGLALVVLGQAYFIWLPRYIWDGVIFCALGALLWAIALRRTEPVPAPSPRRRWWAGITADPLRTALLALGILLVLWAGIAVLRASPDSSFAPYLNAWALGILLFIIQACERPLANLPTHRLANSSTPLLANSPPRKLAPSLTRPLADSLLLPLLLLAALLVRAVALDEIPPNFGGDEGTQALEAIHLLGPPLGNPFSTGWYSVPKMSFLVAGLGMRLFGFTVAGARALSALAGTAAVLVTFLLARELAGKGVGWGAAVLVAFGHYAIHFSRLSSNQIGDALFGPLILYLLLRGLAATGEGNGGRRRNHFRLALAGVVLGLSWYAYFGARLITVVVGLYLLERLLTEPGFLSRHGRGLAILFLGAALTVWPLALYYIAHPADFFSRYNQVTIFASGWLRQEMSLTGRSATSLLLQQFWKSVTAFNVTTDPTFWYRPGIPYLDPISGVFFILGLTVAFRRARRLDGGLLLLWFWAFILGWTLTENPPSSQRGVGVIPVVSILVALGLTETLQTFSRLIGDDAGRWRRLLFGVLLTAIALFNLIFYFQDYTPRRIYGNPTAEVADILCDELGGQADVPPVYFDGPPFMYWDFGGIAFRLRGVTGRDFSPENDMGTVDVSRGALFVVLAERSADLDIIRSAFPGGETTTFHSPADGRLLFFLYEIRH